MGELRRIGDLEIDQDLGLQQREWRVEKIAWSCFGLVLLAGLFGLLGSGPLADAVAGEEGSTLWVEYPRLARHFAPQRMRVHVARAAGQEVRIWIDREYQEGLEIERITPEPDAVEDLPDRLVYSFRPVDGAEALAVELRFEFTGVGWLRAELGAVDGVSVAFHHFVFP